jgi:hypothetical protein
MENVISEFPVTGLQKYGKNGIMQIAFGFLISNEKGDSFY